METDRTEGRTAAGDGPRRPAAAPAGQAGGAGA